MTTDHYGLVFTPQCGRCGAMIPPSGPCPCWPVHTESALLNAVLAERERCAKIADAQAEQERDGTERGSDGQLVAEFIASEIRKGPT